MSLTDSLPASDTASIAGATPTTDADLWPTTLFSSRPAGAEESPGVISARTAYQFALYQRGALLDVRPTPTRERDGGIHPDLHAISLDDITADLDTVAQFSTGRVLLLGDPSMGQQEYSSLVALVRNRTAASVYIVSGGFSAWCEAGLPRWTPAHRALAA